MEEQSQSGVTLSVLKELQANYRIVASKALGQNFLVDPNICRKIAGVVDPDQNVIEIGPGIGSLTVPLARVSKKVFAIEYDQHILAPLDDVLSKFEVSEKVEVINSDVMEVDLEKLAQDKNVETIIGNLPYNISAPLLADIAQKVPSVKHVVAMVQKEVGERLAANQGTRAVSAITLKCQYFMDIEPLFEVASQLFIPRPRVESIVIQMSRRPLVDSDFPTTLFLLIDTSFSQRRKMLRQSLKALFKSNGSQIFEEAGIDPTLRPEQCTLEQFASLSAVYEKAISR